jgi:putative oxidoreductase
MFPAGWPGFALLLLRASVAMALLLENAAHRDGLSVWITGASLVVCVALSAGFLTPIAAAIAIGLHALIWSSLSVGNLGTGAIICGDAIALALLGPGAYSFDSRRFGRRIVVQTPP